MSRKPSLPPREVRFRRRLFEQLGSDRYSKLGLNGLDDKLQKYLDCDSGVFVELGANDGLNQSNTYYLERWRGWRGILIEAIPELYVQAVRNRPLARVFCCACVSFDYPNPNVEMAFASLMSVVKGSWSDSSKEQEHVAIGRQLEQITNPYNISVPARTLTSILDECQVSQIDLLSLDVEGYEAQVLRGLDLDRYQPQMMLIELRNRVEVDAVIAHRYEPVAQLSHHDVLYRVKK